MSGDAIGFPCGGRTSTNWTMCCGLDASCARSCAVLCELPLARERDTATLMLSERGNLMRLEDPTNGPDIEVQTWDHQVFWMEREIEPLDVD